MVQNISYNSFCFAVKENISHERHFALSNRFSIFFHLNGHWIEECRELNRSWHMHEKLITQ